MDAATKTIIYDHREQRSGVPSHLAEFGMQVQAANLAVDYIVAKDCFVERKTVADFITSIANGRLFRQVGYLARSCKYPLLLLEGGGLYLHERIPANTVRGTLLWISMKKHVPVLRTASGLDTAHMLRLLTKYCGDTQSIESVPKLKPRISPWQKQINILTQVEGIGRSTAKELLATFGSIANIAKVPDCEILALPRMGMGRVAALRQVFPAHAQL